MKSKLCILLLAAVFGVSAAELAVKWKESLAATPPGAAVVKGWKLNNYRKNPKIGTGEVIEENGVKFFRIVTTSIDTSFHTTENFLAQAGDTLEIEVTASGKGHLMVSCCAYQLDKKFFVMANNKIQYILPKNQKKTWTITKKLSDGKQGQKLGRITLVIGGGGKGTLDIYDFKARLIKAK